jgi:molybdenum ABC transporter molybdate-binding protein
MRPPIEKMLIKFKKETGIGAQVSFEASNVFLGQLKLRPHGDVFIPADRYYTDKAVKSGLVEKPKVYAYLMPVIMVQKGNPLRVRNLVDLTHHSIRVGLVDERTGAIGNVSAAVLRKNNINIHKINVVYRATKVDELANAIKLKSIDAVIVWKPIAMLYPKDGEIVNIPNDKNVIVTVSAGIVSTSLNKPAALEFLRFLTSKTGKAILEKYHYPTIDPRK